MDVGILDQVFQLVLLIVGVDRYRYRTDLRRGEEEGQPVGHVGGPDADVRTMVNADRQHTLRHVIHTLVELFPRETQVAVRVDDVFLVGRCLGPMLQPLP